MVAAGELIRVLDRGTSSMRVLLESMLFSIGPALFDVLAAATLLYSKQAWIAAIVLVSVLFYVPVTIIITEYRGEMRREMNTLDNKVGSKVFTHHLRSRIHSPCSAQHGIVHLASCCLLVRAYASCALGVGSGKLYSPAMQVQASLLGSDHVRLQKYFVSGARPVRPCSMISAAWM